VLSFLFWRTRAVDVGHTLKISQRCLFFDGKCVLLWRMWPVLSLFFACLQSLARLWTNYRKERNQQSKNTPVFGVGLWALSSAKHNKSQRLLGVLSTSIRSPVSSWESSSASFTLLTGTGWRRSKYSILFLESGWVGHFLLFSDDEFSFTWLCTTMLLAVL
jgi:hypothetical protein